MCIYIVITTKGNSFNYSKRSYWWLWEKQSKKQGWDRGGRWIRWGWDWRALVLKSMCSFTSQKCPFIFQNCPFVSWNCPYVFKECLAIYQKCSIAFQNCPLVFQKCLLFVYCTCLFPRMPFFQLIVIFFLPCLKLLR